MAMIKLLFMAFEDGQSQKFGSVCCSLGEDVSAGSAMAICSMWDGCDYAVILSIDLKSVWKIISTKNVGVHKCRRVRIRLRFIYLPGEILFVASLLLDHSFLFISDST